MKQLSTDVTENVYEKFQELCQRKEKSAYLLLRELVEFIIGENDEFSNPEPVGMTAQEALATKPKPNWMLRPARERLIEQWRAEGRYNQAFHRVSTNEI